MLRQRRVIALALGAPPARAGGHTARCAPAIPRDGRIAGMSVEEASEVVELAPGVAAEAAGEGSAAQAKAARESAARESAVRRPGRPLRRSHPYYVGFVGGFGLILAYYLAEALVSLIGVIVLIAWLVGRVAQAGGGSLKFYGTLCHAALAFVPEPSCGFFRFFRLNGHPCPGVRPV